MRRRDTLQIQKALDVVGTDYDSIEARIDHLYELLAYLTDQGQIVWAWCHMQGGGGTVEKLQSYNIQSVTNDGGRYLVLFERAIETLDYVAIAGLQITNGLLQFGTSAESSTGFRVNGYHSTTGANVDVSTITNDAGVIVYGRLRDGQ